MANPKRLTTLAFPVIVNKNYIRDLKFLFGSSLIAFWLLNEKSGAVALDVSGNGRNGSYTGVSLANIAGPTSPRTPGAPLFNGSTSVINIYSAGLAGAFNGAEGTFGQYIKLTSASLTDGLLKYFALIRVDANNKIQFIKSTANYWLDFIYAAGGTTKEILLASNKSTAWLHLAITWSKANDRVRMYVNGLQYGATLTGLGTWVGALSSTRNVLGANDLTPTYVHSGWMAPVFMLNREATASEILQTARGTAFYDVDPANCANAAAALTITTSDGSGQATHPAVYDAGAGLTWNGYRYWMAMTPYPGSVGTWESPEVLASADGTTWIVPAGLTNPIEPVSGGLNPDPEFLMIGNTLYCFWVFEDGTAIDYIYCRKSTDGITWTDKTLILQSTDKLVSPSLVLDGGVYKLWTNAGSGIIQYRTATAFTGPWSDPITCVFTASLDYFVTNFWHHDIVKVGDRYYGFFNQEVGHAWFGISNDGINWRIDREITLALATASWDARIYRGTLVWNGMNFDLWYSGFTAALVWGIGRTTITGILA